LTGISKITTSQILNLLTPSLINGFILDANSGKGNGGNPAGNAENISGSVPTTTPENQAGSVLGVNHVVSQMLSTISAKGNWKPTSNIHATVNPLALMRYLCRLVTPPGGIVLDPFAGSGSTGKAAIAEGFRFIGIELNPEYVAIAEARIGAMQPALMAV
jgi:hypothetical protein